MNLPNMVTKGPESIISSRPRGAVNRRFITTLVIKKIYLSKYWNIPGTIFDKKKKALDFSDLPPQKAIEKIIDFTWDYYISNPWFLKIVHSENQSKGVHYAKSQRLLEINHAHLQLMESLLDEGKKQNIFKPDIDPLQVNINIAALGGYYLINQHTLGLVYHISMVSPQALEARRKVIKETILSWLLVDPSSTARE